MRSECRSRRPARLRSSASRGAERLMSRVEISKGTCMPLSFSRTRGWAPNPSTLRDCPQIIASPGPSGVPPGGRRGSGVLPAGIEMEALGRSLPDRGPTPGRRRPPRPPCRRATIEPLQPLAAATPARFPRIGYQPSDRLEPTMVEAFKSPRFRVNFPFLQKLQGRVGKLASRLLLLLVPLVLLRACALTYIPPDSIGVRQVSYGLTEGSKGLQKEAVNPGYRREIAGYERIHTFPRDIQVVEFTNNPVESSLAHRQMSAINVPTVDGYPVDVDVTVLYRLIDPYKVASKFGFSKGYEESVVIRFTDFLVKRYLGELRAEQFYHEARLARVLALKAELARRMAQNGLKLVDVLIRQYDYPATFQSLTEQKKIQDQKVLANRELT